MFIPDNSPLLSLEDRIQLAILDLQDPDFQYNYPPPLTEIQELKFIIESQNELLRRKDSEIEVLTMRLRRLCEIIESRNLHVVYQA